MSPKKVHFANHLDHSSPTPSCRIFRVMEGWLFTDIVDDVTCKLCLKDIEGWPFLYGYEASEKASHMLEEMNAG